ncbi:hypothetical protein AKJ16_DCAP00488 [Drosera capensis]
MDLRGRMRIQSRGATEVGLRWLAAGMASIVVKYLTSERLLRCASGVDCGRTHNKNTTTLMATATATLSLPTLISRCISTNAPLHSQRPRFVSSSFPSPSIFTIHGRRFGNVNYALKASTEGLPNDLVEDSKFVPLNTDDPSYGPPVNTTATERHGRGVSTGKPLLHVAG